MGTYEPLTDTRKIQRDGQRGFGWDAAARAHQQGDWWSTMRLQPSGFWNRSDLGSGGRTQGWFAPVSAVETLGVKTERHTLWVLKSVTDGKLSDLKYVSKEAVSTSNLILSTWSIYVGLFWRKPYFLVYFFVEQGIVVLTAYSRMNYLLHVGMAEWKEW